ncbi:GrpB family protein [Janthinobacterium sp. BJB304]|uniref:GrpB family protein n=1 Tax=Janthinobacterium sp. BJB304 TaxID=1572871 RepID=UPI0015D4D670|nr:GrpB family protein [Janthinobacterium sp. BJB304]
MNTVEIFDYNPAWKAQFAKEAEIIQSKFKNEKIYIDHVGSTSIANIASKPIIDILISINNWSNVERLVLLLEGLGYIIDEKCDNVPRYFLTKYRDREIGFHVHICEPHRRWGREMLIFKDELSNNHEFSKDYVNLKKKLAIAHHKDVRAYTHGKKIFIETRLREVENEFSVNQLLTHQRAELNSAEQLQVKMMLTQILISLIAAASVYSNDNKYLFAAAALGFILILLWTYYNQNQQIHRSAGDQARRAVLLISGLDKDPSIQQKLRISDGFSVSVSSDNFRREEDHFATRESPSYKRLAEMIEESSYWTRDLQRYSANVVGFIFLVLVGFVAIVVGAAIVSMQSDNLISITRAILAIMVFLISSDSLVLFLGYKNSAATIDEIFKRVESVAARNYLESDTLLLMSDYNAAIEKAPSTLPGVYRLRKRRLNFRWRSYMEAKLSNRSAM